MKKAPEDIAVIALTSRAKDAGPCSRVGTLLDDPMILVGSNHADIKSFTLTLSHVAGTKRGQGRGSFVNSVTSLVDRFYVDVLRNLKNWSASPPSPTEAPKADAQEVFPPQVGAELPSLGMAEASSDSLLPSGSADHASGLVEEVGSPSDFSAGLADEAASPW